MAFGRLWAQTLPRNHASAGLLSGQNSRPTVASFHRHIVDRAHPARRRTKHSRHDLKNAQQDWPANATVLFVKRSVRRKMSRPKAERSIQRRACCFFETLSRRRSCSLCDPPMRAPRDADLYIKVIDTCQHHEQYEYGCRRTARSGTRATSIHDLTFWSDRLAPRRISWNAYPTTGAGCNQKPDRHPRRKNAPEPAP
jgi:hypothetical protein